MKAKYNKQELQFRLSEAVMLECEINNAAQHYNKVIRFT